MRFGFLFGAGAEIAYELPSGGRFALDIFRQETSDQKKQFKEMLKSVEPSTAYANQWLPKDYLNKSINVFGKNVFQNLIMSTVKHKRELIVNKINSFDDVARMIVDRMSREGIDVNNAFEALTGRKISNIQFGQVISYNDALKKGNSLFESNYFSALLMIYRDNRDKEERKILGRIILAIMQIQLGALSETLSQDINDNLFSKKDDKIDLFDDFGDLIRVNYNEAGVSGLELLLDKYQFNKSEPYGILLNFAMQLIEEIFASVLDYKSIIDENWHYLYSPSSDWAKFCRISVFLLTVHSYIQNLGNKADKNNKDGYYNMLRMCLDEGMYEVSAIATTNYNTIIEDILGYQYPVSYLNGSVGIWYDSYLNKTGTESALKNYENHIIVPLLFTQSGTKPMTSIGMSEKYVDLYRKWKKSNAIIVVGYGFGTDDEHINGILRTLVNDDKRKLIVVDLKSDKSLDTEGVSRKLKVTDNSMIRVMYVDETGKVNGKPWTRCLMDINW